MVWYLLAALTLMAASCSRTGYLAEPDPEFDGVWVVTSIELDGRPVELGSGNIVIDIDTSVAEVQAATGCRLLLGSFTFLDDGRSGFTLPGGTKPRCDDDEERWLIDLDQAFAEAIGGVEAWSGSGDELVLTGPESELVLEAPRIGHSR